MVFACPIDAGRGQSKLTSKLVGIILVMLGRKQQADATAVPWRALTLKARLKSSVRGAVMRFGYEVRKAAPVTAAARRLGP